MQDSVRYIYDVSVGCVPEKKKDRRDTPAFLRLWFNPLLHQQLPEG
jgi:hypothetical protein